MLVFQSIFMNANKYQKQTVLPEIFNLKKFSSKKFYVETNPNWVQNNTSVNTSQ